MIKSTAGDDRTSIKVDRIVCLANSYKHDNRCVAGISLVTKHWVRLIGNTVPGCLTRTEARYQDGTDASILDVFEVELGEECSSNSHPEDVLISGNAWQFLRRFDQKSDARLLSSSANKGPTLLNGYGDRVYCRKFDHKPLENSLELIRPEDLWWWIREDKGKRKNRAIFRFGHVSRTRYDLPVTDPHWLESLRLLPTGIYPHSFFFGDERPDTCLTVSLSEAFEGFHYKLVAGVVTLSQ